MRTGARARERAAFRPPKPAPMITTRSGYAPFLADISITVPHLLRFSAMAEGSRSSLAGVGSKPTRSMWVRALIPSVSDAIFVAMLGVLLCTPLAVRLLGDAGIGWHIRTGQQILATHAIPRVDS